MKQVKYTIDFAKAIVSIEGLNVVDSFIVLQEEWEEDNRGYITEDGRVWLTSYEIPYQCSIDDLQFHIDLTERSLRGLKKAKGMLIDNTE